MSDHNNDGFIKMFKILSAVCVRACVLHVNCHDYV